MAKEARGKSKPKALELSAKELVDLLIDEAGESKSSIAKLTQIDLSAISRFHSGQRVANENDFRKLAALAISLKIAE